MAILAFGRERQPTTSPAGAPVEVIVVGSQNNGPVDLRKCLCLFWNWIGRELIAPPTRPNMWSRISRGIAHRALTLFASGRTPSAAGPVLHIDRKPRPCLKDGDVGWPPSPQQCNACAFFSYVRSAILTEERFLHFQLRRDIRASVIPTIYWFRATKCTASD
jgi:hypothetical protein